MWISTSISQLKPLLVQKWRHVLARDTAADESRCLVIHVTSEIHTCDSHLMGSHGLRLRLPVLFHHVLIIHPSPSLPCCRQNSSVRSSFPCGVLPRTIPEASLHPTSSSSGWGWQLATQPSRSQSASCVQTTNESQCSPPGRCSPPNSTTPKFRASINADLPYSYTDDNNLHPLPAYGSIQEG